MHIFNRLISVFILAIMLGACDRVHEAPSPAGFVSPEELNQEYDCTGAGPFELAISRKLLSTTEISIKIKTQTLHGELSLLGNGNFLYRPLAGYSGLDSAIYEVCDPQKCLQGKILLRVSGSCRPVVPDIFLEADWGLNPLETLPDSFGCGSSVTAALGNQAIQFIGSRLWGNFPVNKVDTTYFSLIACNTGAVCDTGNVQVISGLRQCREKFNLRRDTFRLNRNFSGISINLNLLLANDQFCENDLDPLSLEVSNPATGSAFVRQNVQGSFIRYLRTGNAPDSLQYRLRSLSGKQSSASLIILTE